MHESTTSATAWPAPAARSARSSTSSSLPPADVHCGMHVHVGSSSAARARTASRKTTNLSIPGRCSVCPARRIKAKVIWEWLAFVLVATCALSNLPTKRPGAAAAHASIPNERSVIDYDSSRSSRSNILQPRSCGGLKGLIEIIKSFPPPAAA